jgi:SAM-dependent methyltransferase
MVDSDQDREGLAWQVGVWNRISEIYLREIDQRFAPVVDAVVTRARLAAGENVLDLGTGTGAVAERAAMRVGPKGEVVGVDISTDMLALAQRRLVDQDLDNFELQEGRAESIPVASNDFNVVLACLSMMYVIDRGAAAREISRVLRPGGRFIAAVWAGPEQCDIVRFQQTAGKFAGTPPVPGVGPGALADAGPFVAQLEGAGLRAEVESQVLEFEFPDFGSAWDALAGVTTAQLPQDRLKEAKSAVSAAMYPHGHGARRFRNLTQFIVARRSG